MRSPSETARAKARAHLIWPVLNLADRIIRPSFATAWGLAHQVPGWTSRREAMALFDAVRRLPANPVVVEIGSFLGRSSIVLAAACRERRDGRVFCVDPFDGSGDSYSSPVYDAIRRELPSTQIEQFRRNVDLAGCARWVEERQGTAESVSAIWSSPIDLLFLDGDQSRAGMRSAFSCFQPFLKAGGILAVHNSADRRDYQPDHDGGRQLVLESVRAPLFQPVRRVSTTSFGVKT